MKITIRTLIVLFLAATLWGCGASTVTTAEKIDDSKKLTSQEILSLVNGNTLHLVSSNFDAHAYCDENGMISALALYDSQNTDGGNWEVTTDDTICLFFTVWFYSDTNCYSVFYDPRDKNYQFFNDSNVLAFTVTVAAGNSENLLIPKPPKNKEFIRQTPEKEKK